METREPAIAPDEAMPSPVRTRAPGTWREVVGRAAPWIVLGGTAVLIGLTVWLPYNSFLPPPPFLPQSGTTSGAQIEALTVSHVLWLTAAATALHLGLGRRLWLILAAYPFVDALTLDLQYVPNAWVWWTGRTFIGMATAVFAHALVAFPSGLLSQRGDRLLVLIVYVFAASTALVGKMVDATWVATDQVYLPNPFFVAQNDVIGTVDGYVTAIGVPVIGLAVVFAVVRHWRLAGPVGRRALAPAVAALPFAYVGAVVAYVGDSRNIQWLSDLGRHPLLLAVNAVVPLLLLLGITRSRLRRGSVADLVVELGQGVPLGSLRDRIARSVGDPTLELAFPAPGGHGFVDGDGRSFPMPEPGDGRSIARLERDGETLAVLVHDAAIDEESPGLVEAIAGAARLALENERLAAEVRAQLDEVRASRARIAEAADVERRRVERDLHDGAQQRLVALTMRLEQARASAVGSTALIDEATSELRVAIDEVRQLARGMHPPILTEAGLAAAVDSLAERLPLPVEVRLPGDRFPPSIEGAAYFVIAEALTNVTRYSGGAGATVEGSLDGGRLVVRIRDAGTGGADPTRGSGLRGLADRVAAVGGSLDVESPPGGGTLIQARFPIG